MRGTPDAEGGHAAAGRQGGDDCVLRAGCGREAVGDGKNVGY